jgi:hypothetical protein
MTINRQQLENGNIQFEDYAQSSRAPFIGQQLVLPMCASGWTVGRFEVIAIQPAGDKVVAEARRIS